MWGDRGDSARAKSRGSPFQLPARLAVGLGLESGLEISCLTSCAPSHRWEFGSPASGFRKEAGLRLQDDSTPERESCQWTAAQVTVIQDNLFVAKVNSATGFPPMRCS